MIANVKNVILMLVISYVIIADAYASLMTEVSSAKGRKCPDLSAHCKVPLSKNDGCCPHNNATWQTLLPCWILLRRKCWMVHRQ